MKAEIKLVSLAVAGMLGIGANLASAIPAANQQGDFRCHLLYSGEAAKLVGC